MIFTNKNGNQINVIESDYNNIINYKKGIMISVHGIGSHFQNIGYKFKYNLEGRSKFFSELNLLSYAIELEGHGLSQGERCCIYNFDDLVEDVKKLIDILREEYDNLPIYLTGFSMGGAIIIHLCIKYPKLINGLVLMAPMCGISDSMKPNKLVEYVLRFLLYFFPTKQWVPGSDDEFLNKCSKNEEYKILKKRDTICYRNNQRLTTAFQCLVACEFIKNNSHLFETPLILFHGNNDLVTDYTISHKFFNRISSKNKEFITLDQGYHNLLIKNDENDKTPEIVMEKLKDWLNDRIENDSKEIKFTKKIENEDNNLLINKEDSTNSILYIVISIFIILFSLIINYLKIFQL